MALHEECGVFGIYRNGEEKNYKPWQISTIANTCYSALYALQHRGQESCGIVMNDCGKFEYKKNMGLVPEVFTADKLMSLGTGNIGLGHVRYGEGGRDRLRNGQPLVAYHGKGPMALSVNGRLSNGAELRAEYEQKGAIFHSTSDSEVISYAITEERLKQNSIEEALETAMCKIKGAYSMLVMSATKLIAVRDPNGFRPLCIGKNKYGDIMFASESCAFDAVGAKFVRDIMPGEIVVLSAGDKGISIRSITTHTNKASSLCIFEFVYFARDDSVIHGASVHNARLRAGEFLHKECPVEADIVIGVPDSGIDAALGFARASGIQYGIGFNKNRYVGRSFIKPTQSDRETEVRRKLNVIKAVVEGKRVVMVDDSIVRGTTCAIIIKLLREAGAREVHVRVSSPVYTHPCYFGTAVEDVTALISHGKSVGEIAEEIGADSVGYISVDAVMQIAQTADTGFCTGCFTGNYPADIPSGVTKSKFEEKVGVVV